MSYPTIYDVSYSYTGFQAALGDGSFPGTQLDADMAGLSDSVASINAFIQVAFRSDGVLKAASLPGTDPILQYVDEAAAAAAASAAEIASAAATSASASATAATSASASATAAAGSATNAATSETQAASSASAAQTARTGAETARTNAVASAVAAAASAAEAATFDPNLFYLRTVLDAKFAAVDEKLSAKASKRNRILNPAFQVNQDRALGATIDYGPSVSGYSIDGVWVGTIGTTVLRAGQIAKRTPGGSKYCHRSIIQVPDASMAAGAYVLVYSTQIEGADVADLMFGTSLAKPFTFRCVLGASVAGTVYVSFRNAGGTRSYIVPVVVTPAEAGAWKTIEISAPGDTGGTWVNDASGTGINVSIAVGCSSTYKAPSSGGWLTGNFIGAADISNGAASAGATFDVGDAGLYEGTDVPAWEMPSYPDDLKACQRYYWRVGTVRMLSTSSGSTYRQIFIKFPVQMRAVPAVSGTSSIGTLNPSWAIGQDYAQPEVTGVAVDANVDLTSWIANARL